MSLYACSFCNLSIPSTSPRAQCSVCDDFNICPSCFVLGTFSYNHHPGHACTIVRTSGSTKEISHSRSLVAPSFDKGWQIFVEHGSSSPTLEFVNLLCEIYVILDSTNTGCVAPEAWSRFLNEMCWQEIDIWTSVFQKSNGSSEAKTEADAALKDYYDMQGAEHKLVLRVGADQGADSRTGHHFSTMFSSRPKQTPGMPLLTQHGFRCLAAKLVFADADDGLQGLNTLCRALSVGMWKAKGEIPRWVLPDRAASCSQSEETVDPGAEDTVYDALERIQILQEQSIANVAALEALGAAPRLEVNPRITLKKRRW